MQPTGLLESLAAVTLLTAGICFHMPRERRYLLVTLLLCSVAIVAVCGTTFCLLSTACMGSCMKQVLFGTISFLTAALISTLKSTAGCLRLQLSTWHRSRNSRLRSSRYVYGRLSTAVKFLRTRTYLIWCHAAALTHRFTLRDITYVRKLRKRTLCVIQ